MHYFLAATASPRRLRDLAVLLTSALALGSATSVLSQGDEDGAKTASEAGIPVTDQTTIRACRSCHEVDDDGNMSRISFMRKTPEGWQTSIRRMVSLVDIELEPDQARTIVRYLSDHHGLAPEEARAGFFDAERRMIDHRYDGDEVTAKVCQACHSFGRALNQRRSKEEWGLLVAMHRGYYPFVDSQVFRSPTPPEDGKHPMDIVVAHLGEGFSLESSEWTAWKATMRPPRLAGTWAITGHQLGKGPFFGSMKVSESEVEGEFKSETRFTYARTGERVERSGSSIVYTGFQWRGRSLSGGGDAHREVFLVERDWSEMSGRWFAGDYDEIGADVTLRRIGADTVITGVSPPAIRAGAQSMSIRIFGANLPPDLAAGDVDFGPGLSVVAVTQTGPGMVKIDVDATAEATVGWRDLVIGGAVLQRAIAVYDEMSRIKVKPLAGMARTGGGRFPKQFQQFEAVAFNDGPDGKPDTEDDLEIGLVDVRWGIEEYGVTYADDDTAFVGAIDHTGLFTPAIDGPNPKRSGNRNNIGDVWVVATHARDDGKELVARGHLLVTVPLYMRWEPWRVSE